VNYWTGSAWSSLGTITGTGWSNFTATTGLTSSTYTIQLKGALESSDLSQDSWNIDAVMLRTWDTTGGPHGHNWMIWSDGSNPDILAPWSWSFNFPDGLGYYEFYSIGKYGLNTETAPGTADASCRLRYQYTLTIGFVGSGSVEAAPAPPYYYNDPVTLTPMPTTGWSFDHWSGDDVTDLVDIGGGSWSITMDDDKSLTATFYEYGSITVIKDAVPDDLQIFSFTGGLGSFTLVDNGGTNSRTFTGLDAGTYTVTETVPSGWYLTDIDIDDPSSDSSFTLPSTTTLLDDGFEGSSSTWDDNWDSISHSWFRSSTRFSGSYSAGSDYDSEGAFTCDNLDASGATSIGISFWYQLDDTEDSDLTLSYYDGSNYDFIANIGGGTEYTWLHYSAVITDSQYFNTNFRIRFSSTLDSGENVWVDDVLITKEVVGKATIVLSVGEDVTVTFTNKLPQTITLRPDAVGTTTQLTRNGGSANWDQVNEETADDSTTYVYGTGDDSSQTDTYNVPDQSLTGTITNVRIYIRAFENYDRDDVYAWTAIRIGTGSIEYGTEIGTTTSWTNYYTAYATKTGNLGSGSWTWADIDDLQIGVGLQSHYSSGSSTWRYAECTQVWAEVTYIP
jgi:hypothetical protein